MQKETWKILIVDDDEQIHLMTTLVLQDIQFQNKAIDLISAYSAEEAKGILQKDKDIALILMDVVMETEHAGLDLVKYIREELKNLKTRIILRTGQPGSAPEKKIIIEYDINDYKEKTELTFIKLFTTVISSLRTYDYISQLESQKSSLQKLIELNTTLFSYNTELRKIPQNLSRFFHSLIIDEDYPFQVLICQENNEGHYEILEDISRVKKTEAQKNSFIQNLQNGNIERSPNRYFSLIFKDPLYRRLIIYLEPTEDMPQDVNEIFQIFINNLQIAFSNISLQEEILETQKDIITTLSEFIEKRSTETALHVYRVSQYCRLLGELANLDRTSLSILEIASPMHDLGKVGITDDILKKPSTLSPDEFIKMKEHTKIGFDILNKSERKILKSAGLISLQHHEHWNGKGYPQGLKEEEIDIMARIVTLVDVFDALYSKRSYKEAWPDDEIIAYMKKNRGEMFDPHLTDLFLDHYQDFKKIALANPD